MFMDCGIDLEWSGQYLCLMEVNDELKWLFEATVKADCLWNNFGLTWNGIAKWFKSGRNIASILVEQIWRGSDTLWCLLDCLEGRNWSGMKVGGS